jgi:uncharacterized protein (TIGR03086 family)
MHTNTSTGIVALDALAVRVSIDLVAGVTSADLARPTPCADWTLHGLLRHMIAQHYGFAAASAGDGDLANWMLRPLGPDPVAAYRAAAEHVLDAFAADGVLEREFPLPELKLGQAFPGRQAISFHFVDYVVHSWDVAATLGLTADLEFDPALVDAARRVAQAVPGGGFRTEPGAAFAPAVDLPVGQLGGASGAGLEEVVALLGRSPGWRPAVGISAD